MIAAAGSAAGAGTGPSTTSEFTCRASARWSRSIGSERAAHALRSGSEEVSGAHRLLRRLERRRHVEVLAARERRQLRVRAAVVGHHALGEGPHGRPDRALRCDASELDLGRAACRGLAHELTIRLVHQLDLSRRRTGQGDQRRGDEADDGQHLHDTPPRGATPASLAARRVPPRCGTVARAYLPEGRAPCEKTASRRCGSAARQRSTGGCRFPRLSRPRSWRTRASTR